MGKQIGGINGPYLGKVGDVVGYQWKGKWITRSMPKVFHDAESEGQLKERSRLGASMGLAARMRDILLIGFKQVADERKMTEYNYFYHINNDSLAWDGESLAVDYEGLRVSEGPVAPVGFGAVEVVGEMTLAIDFEKNPEHRVSNGNDKVYVAAVCPSRREAVLSLPVYRRMKRITVVLPQAWEGLDVHLYGFVQDAAGRVSMSSHIAGGTLSEIEETTQEASTLDLPDDSGTAAPHTSQPETAAPSSEAPASLPHSSAPS